MKLYKCDVCQKATKKPMVIWEFGDEELHFCSFKCAQKWVEEQIEQVEKDRKPFEFLRD